MLRFTFHASIAQAFLDHFYAVPNPCDTYEQWLVWTHQDLPEMDRAHLSLQLERLRDRLRHDQAPDPWLVERLDRIEKALRRAH